jgi:peptide/nickel transport system permease protein
MLRFILKRLLLTLPLLLGMTLITFLAIQLAPGDFLANLKLNPQISPETIRLYANKFHLDKPLWQQYLIWLKNILHGDFGDSFSYRAPVAAVIASRAFNTFILSLSSLIFTWTIVIPLGVLAALNRDKFIDRLISFLSYLGMALPAFFLALILLYFSTFTGWLPLGGMRSLRYDELSFLGKLWDLARHLIIPTIVLSVGSICTLQRIMRANLLEVLGSAYIFGAKARGISRKRIFFVHALKNALNPMITIFGYQFSALLSGAALVEIVIGWPGLGVVMLEAVQSQDLYLVMGSVLMGGGLLITGNLAADISLAYFDPRIRLIKNVQ